MAKKKEGKEKKAKKAKKSLSIKGNLVLVALLLLALAFLPTSMLIAVGMLPSLMALITSSKGVGARASTVTAMNLAGCVPFVFKLWSSGNDFAVSFDIITNSRYIMIIYLAAAFGFMIDWVVTGLVSSFMYQKGMARMKAIKKRQKALIENWGPNVSGGLVEEEEDS